MRVKITLVASILAVTLLTTAGWAVPASHVSSTAVSAQGMAPQTQSASGKVVTNSSKGFSIEVRSVDTTSTMQFVVDKNTVIEGKLETGSTATVDYKVENGKNIATHVTVSPTK